MYNMICNINVAIKSVCEPETVIREIIFMYCLLAGHNKTNTH